MTQPDEATNWLWQRAETYLQIGLTERAECLLLLAHHRAPAHPGILWDLARAFLANDQASRCLTSLDALTEQMPEWLSPSSVLLLRIRALQQLQQTAQARQQLQDYFAAQERTSHAP